MPVSNWKKLFSPLILARGRDYYREGAIRDLASPEEGVFTAIAQGTRPYRVRVEIRGQRTLMDCDCPHARSGWRCKHMAALLFAVESQTGASEPPKQSPMPRVPEVQVPLFALAASPEEEGPDTFRDARSPYDLKRILAGRTVPQTVLRKAEELLQGGVLRLTGLEESAYPFTHLLASFTVYEPGHRYPFLTRLELSRERVLDARCGGPDPLCRRAGGPSGVLCAHLAASLLSLNTALTDPALFDDTDPMGELVLRRFGLDMEAAPAQAEGQTLSLAPVLEIRDDDRWSLALRIGSSRLVYVSSLPDLAEAIRTGGTLRLGATGAARFNADRFDDKSRKLADFACRWSENDTALHLQYANGASSQDAGSLPLYGERLDDFFDLCRGTPLPVRSMKKHPLTLAGGDFLPRVTLTLLREGDRVSGMDVTGFAPRTVLGLRSAYYLDLDRSLLVRADAAQVRLWQKHFPSLRGEFSFRIGRGSLPDFYRRVVPFLREHTDLTENPEDTAVLSRWLPPEAQITFYLDTGEDRSTCRVEAAYGEEKYTLMPSRPPAPPWRETFRETGALNAAAALFPYADDSRELLYRPRDDQFTYTLLKDGLMELERWGRVLATDRFSSVRVRRAFQVHAGVRLNSGLMDLEVTCQGLSEDELMEILRNLDPKKKWHRLKNGDFVDLTDPGIDSLLSLMEAAHVSPKEFVRGKMHLPAYRALYLDTLLRDHQEIVSARDASFRKLIRTFKTVSESDFEVPLSLRPVLRPYQTAGFQWLMTLSSAGFGGILADDMGLGKTVQMIAALLYQKEHPCESGPQTHLIVCPASLVYNWEAEIQRFAPQLRTGVVTGSAAQRHRLLACWQDYDVLITSYDLLKRDADQYEGLSFGFHVLDEAQYIKTASSAAAKSCKVILSRHRFAMTGTPIENSLGELWSIFDFLMPGFLYDYPAFRRELEVPAVRDGAPEAMERLKKMVSPFLLRRLKKDVLKDLPDKLEETRTVVLEGLQDQLYSAQVLRLRQILGGESDEEFSRSRIMILSELTRLRQICCDPSLVTEGYAGPSAKREALAELLQGAAGGGHKVLVFSQFTSMLSLIQRDLEEMGLACYLLTGDTPKEERARMSAAFNRNGVPVFLISLKAGGTGLNLTGADIVVHYDPWWNAAATHQATDRAHRIGQEKTVTVYSIVCKNTIEEQILALQKSKQELADELLTGRNGGFSSLSREDLLALLDR